MQDKDLERYSRHILLPDIEFEGQNKLLQSHCLIIGAGGLGSPVAIYLAASGVGEMTICDFDEVDLSNLQRQITHNEKSIGKNKAESAKIAIKKINSNIKIKSVKEQLNANEVMGLAKDVDIIIDCSDNFNTRYSLNKIAFDLKLPLVSGAAIKYDGQVSVFDFRSNISPCYNCLFPEGNEDQNLKCSDHGVFSPLVGLIGSIQAGEVIKVLLGFGTSLNGKLLLVNNRDTDFKILKIQKDSLCKICA